MSESVEDVRRLLTEYRRAYLANDSRRVNGVFGKQLGLEVGECRDHSHITLTEWNTWREELAIDIEDKRQTARGLGDFLGQKVIRWFMTRELTRSERFELFNIVEALAWLCSKQFFILGTADRMIDLFELRIQPRSRGPQITPFDVLQDLPADNRPRQINRLAEHIVASWRRYCTAMDKAHGLFFSNSDEAPERSSDPNEESSQEEEREEICNRMRRAMERLPPREAELLIERYVDDLSCKAIGEYYNWQLPTVYVRLSEVRNKMKELYQQQWAYEEADFGRARSLGQVSPLA